MSIDSIALTPFPALPTAHPADDAFRPTLRLVPTHPADPVRALTRRERQVLGLIAEGRSNNAICGELFISPKTLERHVQHIFAKLELPPSADQHRRVRAVLAWLRSPLSEQSGG
jgi:DNA-binding NarL/FixJ family response regulator